MESDPNNNANQCAVCLLVLLGGELGVLGCGHVFHLECLESSLRFRPLCPICRSPAKRAQKLYFDIGAISKDLLGEWRESKAVALVQTLETDLKQAQLETRVLREELTLTVTNNTRLGCELEELTAFKSTSFTKEMQLRRELKSVTEEVHELHSKLAASENKIQALEVLVDNLQGENKYLKRPNWHHHPVAPVIKSHRPTGGSAPVLSQQAMLEPVSKRHQPQPNPFHLSRTTSNPGKQLTLKPFFSS